MKLKFFAALVPLCLVALPQFSAEAQIVRLFPGGGVNVRAPFVRVNVDPYGNTSVRAPFVNINPAGNYGPVNPQPRYQPYPNNFRQPVYPNQPRRVPGQPYNPNVRTVAPNSVAPGPITNNQPINAQPNSVGNNPPRNVVNRQPTNLNQPSNKVPNLVQPNNSTANKPKPAKSPGDRTVSVLDGGDSSEKKVVQPLIPKPAPLGRYREMNYQELRRAALDAATQLDRDLNQMVDGTKWKRQLRGGTIRDFMADDVNEAPDAEAIKTLRPILENIEAVNKDAEKQAVNGLESFQNLRQVLAELLQPPVPRQQQVLAHSGQGLNAALSRFTTAESWQKFLTLPESVYSTDKDAATKLSADLANLKKALVKYDNSKKNADYKLVTQLPEFAATHQHLALLINLLEQDSSPLEKDSGRLEIDSGKKQVRPVSVFKKK